ncbi:transcription termination/antitermination protein NusG [Rickettsiales bacterium LUAb2]
MTEIKAKWYILQVYSGFENKVVEAIKEQLQLKNLEQFVEEIIVPVQDVLQVKQGKKSTIKKNFLPGYVLIKTMLTDEVLGLIRSVPRVSSFLGGNKGSVPFPVAEQEVNQILQKIQENVEKSNTGKSQFEVGETVSIADGPFASLNGVVEDVDNVKNKLKILVSIFDRMVPVELEFHQVEKVENN